MGGCNSQLSSPGNLDLNGKDSSPDKRRYGVPPWSWAILASAAAWGILMVFIPPARQDFPLGDDWAFAHGAFWFAHGEGIHYSKWAGMPQLGQWLFSWPFILVVGPSHVALRLSTIVLSWLGIASLFQLLRQENLPHRLAAFACFAVVMNPLFFVSQCTYMTDVPALSFGLIALNGYGQAMAQRNRLWLAAAMVAASLGCITRQTLVFVPIVAAIMLLRHPDLDSNRLGRWPSSGLESLGWRPPLVCRPTGCFDDGPDLAIICQGGIFTVLDLPPVRAGRSASGFADAAVAPKAHFPGRAPGPVARGGLPVAGRRAIALWRRVSLLHRPAQSVGNLLGEFGGGTP